MEHAKSPKIRFAGFEIDPAQRRLKRGETPIPLNAKAFDLLLFLGSNPGRTISKEEILDSIWKDQFVEESNLAVQVSAIRRALNDKASDPRILATIPGKGYQFIAQIEQVTDVSDVAVPADGEPPMSPSEGEAPTEALPQPGPAGLTRNLYIGVALVSLLVITGVVFLYTLGRRGGEIRSVAVMPFVEESGPVDGAYLGDGIAESVIFSLSRLPEMKVMSRHSSFRYRDAAIDARRIGRELAVEAVLTGRITRQGDSVSISAELVSARDSRVIWGGQFMRRSSDLEMLQSDIARAITGELKIRLSEADESELAKGQTQDHDAYNHYLVGRHHLNRLTDDGFARARDSFRMAVAKDPEYALAHAALAESYNMLSGWGSVAPNEAYPLAKASAVRALEIDGSLAEAHAALGVVKLFYDLDWAGADQELARAAELNPNYAVAHQYRSLLYVMMGRPEEAMLSIGRARELDPLSLLNLVMEGNVHYYARRPAEAIEVYRRAVDMDSNSGVARWSLGNAYLLAERSDEAAEEYRRSIVLSGNSPDEKASLAYLYARNDRTDEARKILTELTGQEHGGYVPPALLAAIHGALGENDRAFELLERSARERDSMLLYLRVDPIFDPLRPDPRFSEMLRRIGLSAEEGG